MGFNSAFKGLNNSLVFAGDKTSAVCTWRNSRESF